MKAYKVLTHDLCPPIRGGDPVFDGVLPYRLPPVEVDTGPDDCAAGWNACCSAVTALRIGGLWPNGQPSRLFEVRNSEGPIIKRGDKVRAASWMVVREVEVNDKILAELHRPMAGDDLPVEDLVAEVQAWRRALARPRRDPGEVERGLRKALAARGLESWALHRYDTARDARDAWAAWAAWDAWAARAAWAAWDAWDVWDVWDAWDALTLYVAACRGWLQRDPLLLTVGLRDAYEAGLQLVAPTGPKELGWTA